MTPEELELYKKCQPLFEGMGWEVGDRVSINGEAPVFLSRFIDDGVEFSNESYFSDLKYFESRFLHLPAAIDDLGEGGQPSKRCLWGMVDWTKYSISTNDDGTLDIWEQDADLDDEKFRLYNATPTIALLRALLQQEGYEQA